MKHSYLAVGWALLGLAGILGAAEAPGPENFGVVIGSADICKTDEVVQTTIDVNLVLKVGEVQGFSFGVCTADESVAKAVAGAVGADVLTAKCGEPASFKRVNILRGGVTMGVVVDFDAVCKIDANPTYRAARITYDVLAVPAEAADCTPQFETALALCDDLGTPKVQSVAVVAGVSIKFQARENQNGAIRVGYKAVPPLTRFVRADANADARVDIADGIWILNELFFSERYPDNRTTCQDAADANNDAQIDASDAMYIFNWLFKDGPVPPEPWTCGTDPEDTDPENTDGLGCESYAPCA